MLFKAHIYVYMYVCFFLWSKKTKEKTIFLHEYGRQVISVMAKYLVIYRSCRSINL